MEGYLLWMVMYLGTPDEVWSQQTTFPLPLGRCQFYKRQLEEWLTEKPEDFRDPKNIRFVCNPKNWRLP